MRSFFPLDVLDEIWDLIESVSDGFPTYSCFFFHVSFLCDRFECVPFNLLFVVVSVPLVDIF